MVDALRMLAYGQPADAVDEYICIGQTTILETLKNFRMTVYYVFGRRYLREPTAEDIQRLSRENAARGFPGYLGSVDCMHWEWKNCPTGWRRHFTRHVSAPTSILEAVASYDTWIWHAFFGMPCSCNDLNVLLKSSLFENLMRGRASPCNFTVNNRIYNIGYYLGDGIYPPFATIVKAFREPISTKKVKFTEVQQACRKDVERAFGVLQARFEILAGPARFWDPRMLHLIMMTCVILRNMIVEDEHHDPSWLPVYDQRGILHPAETRRGLVNKQYREMRRRLTDTTAHYQLRNDLVDHQWEMRGAGLLSEY